MHHQERESRPVAAAAASYCCRDGQPLALPNTESHIDSKSTNGVLRCDRGYSRQVSLLAAFAMLYLSHPARLGHDNLPIDGKLPAKQCKCR